MLTTRRRFPSAVLRSRPTWVQDPAVDTFGGVGRVRPAVGALDAVTERHGTGPLARPVAQHPGQGTGQGRLVTGRDQTVPGPILADHLEVRWDAAGHHRGGRRG